MFKQFNFKRKCLIIITTKGLYVNEFDKVIVKRVIKVFIKVKLIFLIIMISVMKDFFKSYFRFKS